MTNEEVIRALLHIRSAIRNHIPPTKPGKAIEAVDLAIAALERDTPKRVGMSEWKGYRNTRYKCPGCGKNARNDETYCHKCGQRLVFPRISFTDYVLGQKQEVIITWTDEEPPKEET